MLDLAGLMVTLDAMGCQREIARQIIDQEGHYILAVKENQPALHAKVTTLLDEAILDNFKGMRHGYCEQTAEKNNHGRIETRREWVTDEAHWLGEDLLGQWAGLSSLKVGIKIKQQCCNASPEALLQALVA